MNTLTAYIRHIKRSGELALIELESEGERFSALIISNNEPYIAEGGKVKMIFKEAEMSVAKNLTGEISLRNRFVSRVKSFKRGELLTELFLDFKGHEIGSVITTASFDRMKITVGDQVTGLVKTNELMLMQYD